MRRRAASSWPPKRGNKMAKGQLRSNREAKKPKQPKKSPSPGTDLFRTPASKAAVPSAVAKKK
ncbi:hypothetical protein BWU74_15825 [Paraburkholderia caledonica]|nr:hypothetical protein BWU74_15825 [Burkholderia sp. Bk]